MAQEKWTPKYPEFATRPAGSGLNDDETGDDWMIKDANGAMRPLEWVPAPATSHLHSFAYESARVGSPYFSRLAKISGLSKLYVRFKPNGKQTKITHYAYKYTDDRMGESHFDLMRAATRPGAEVVNAILIAQQIPYERLS